MRYRVKVASFDAPGIAGRLASLDDDVLWFSQEEDDTATSSDLAVSRLCTGLP